MIKVDISLNDEGQVTDIIMSGHADSGEYGKDIVCAGASAVVFGTTNAIIGLTDETPDIDYSDDGGYFHIRSVNLENEQAQTLLQGLIISLKTIEEEYRQYIKLNYK